MIIGGDKSDENKLTHEPRFESGPIDGEIVVFIHGYMGTPRQFDNLAGAVHLQGYSYKTLLLPGHSVTLKEFSESTHTAWQEYVDSEIACISERYSKIWLVGHSMGCLLSLNAAIKFPDKICGIFAIACPLKIIYFSLLAYKVQIKKRFGGKNSIIKSAYVKFSSVPQPISLIWRIIKPNFEFLKIQHKTKKILGQVKTPITGIFSKKDEVVSMKSLKLMQSELRNCDFNSVLLYESLHAYYPKHEQAMIEQALLGFIR
ncbi:MAG: alpha/beta fold hydrolase [Oscillospiraceae bacterium]|nr:alpha/beta fold hydrolase [Oscillospiraceae bacterium]MCL2278367.1 alpha/beta fold hydrolase [Oscillospiraceae bacterium]